ncbi:MAG: hypothetical protein DSY70_00235 [Desulfobulbus sp.]|nr:MAG: hypothetical protein DSY70_00235 [Desulfobulbus sp.]
MSEVLSNSDKQPLDEVMLAMDVVDTLRHQGKLVEQELDSDLRDERLKEKLRKIYRTQGIEVPDHVLEEGVQALREDRFSYKPPPKGVATWFATVYINRGRWGKWLLRLLAAFFLVWGMYYFMVAGPRSAMPDKIKSSYQATWHSAQSERAKNVINRINAEAETAVEKGDQKAMEKALDLFARIKSVLDQQYSLRVVVRPGERSGVWRVPDVNSSARNYYIIVEPVGPGGEILEVPVTSEETGKEEMVSKWGVRVDRRVFERIGADKKDDGIIQDNILGEKKKGYLVPDYSAHVGGGAITSW